MMLESARKIRAGELPTGNLYTVDLPDEHIDKMLDWDKPLSEQPESVREALKKAAFANPSDMNANIGYAAAAKLTDAFDAMDGNGFYRKIQEQLGRDQSAASEYLKSIGIPGIRYLDGSSRTKGEGTRNFVLFDPSIAKIIGRD